MLQTLGVNYPAIIVRDMEDSIRFYQRLGLQPLYVEPNRDDPESIVALLSAGGDHSFLMLVGPMKPGTVRLAEAQPGIGSMQYLSFHVTLEQMNGMWDELSRSGVQGSEQITRGYERLVFLEDPNGVLITLVAWGVEPPPSMPKSLVLQVAAMLRERDGSMYIEESHVAGAIKEIETASRGE
jgi:catechol 2,3-dioxygenase-like lactoylglutathione lyase family enzyme